jgi:hypothetical protein
VECHIAQDAEIVLLNAILWNIAAVPFVLFIHILLKLIIITQ